MEQLALNGLWLIGALAAAVLVGVFVSQYIKDRLTGVPSPLRTALQSTEASALAALKEAQAAVVTDITNLVSPAVAGASGTTAAVAAHARRVATGATGATGAIVGATALAAATGVAVPPNVTLVDSTGAPIASVAGATGASVTAAGVFLN